MNQMYNLVLPILEYVTFCYQTRTINNWWLHYNWKETKAVGIWMIQYQNSNKLNIVPFRYLIANPDDKTKFIFSSVVHYPRIWNELSIFIWRWLHPMHYFYHKHVVNWITYNLPCRTKSLPLPRNSKPIFVYMVYKITLICYKKIEPKG